MAAPLCFQLPVLKQHDHANCVLDNCLSAETKSAAKPCLPACSCEQMLCALDIALCVWQV